MSHLGVAIKEVDGAIQDVYLDSTNNLAIVVDAEAIGQHVKQRTKTFQGEWFLNSRIGVPWINNVLGRNFDTALAEAVLKSVIRKTNGVTSIESFSARFDSGTRNLITDNTTIKTIYDEASQ